MDWIDANDPTTALLADTTIEASGLKTIGTNTTVGHDSFIKDTVSTKRQKKFPSPTKIDIGKVGIFETNFTNISIFEDSPSKIDIFKATLTESSIGKISPRHITAEETTVIHTGIDEFSKAQVTFVEPTQLEVGVGEVNLLVNNSFINSIVLVSLNFPASKISFSPSTLSNQFFSIHDSTPQMIDRD